MYVYVLVKTVYLSEMPLNDSRATEAVYVRVGFGLLGRESQMMLVDTRKKREKTDGSHLPTAFLLRLIRSFSVA